METLITFVYNALAGVAGNIIYKLLNDSLEKENVDELVKYKNSEDFENFKKEMESILKHNKQLKTELEKLESKKSVTQNNINGDNFYANGDQTNIGVQNVTHNYATPKDELKKS